MPKTFRAKFGILGIILIAIIGIFHLSPKTFALEGAKWKNDSRTEITFEGKTFKKASPDIINKLPENLRKGEVFVQDSVSTSGAQNLQVINLDKIEANINGKVSTVTVGVDGSVTEGANPNATNAEEAKTSCAIEGGMGWIVCGISLTLSKAADELYGLVEKFLQVQPLQVTNKSGVYVVWDYMKNIANVIFAIVLVVIVYSQISNVGISNYGIKKMLPKLIIAAILINLSYYICAIFLDLSNIVGYQFQNMLVEIRKGIFNGSSEISVQAPKWSEAIPALVAGVGYGAYTFAATGGWVGLAFTAMMVLLGVLYSAFVAFMILAARQAIITVLIFLSPLAFAASILPNTEKWFEKWKDVFTTMLVMYPLIALVFGGAQLAGMTIIANANGSFAVMLLGLAVQAIPLAITPTIVRISGSLLGKFAGMVNNPNKGPIDTAKKYLEQGRENHINNRIANGGNLTSLVKGMSYRRQSRHAGNKKIAEQYQQQRFQDKQAAYQERVEGWASKLPAGSLLQNAVKNSSQLNRMVAAQEILESSNNLRSAKISEIKADALRASLIIDQDGKVTGVKSEEDLKKSLGKLGTQIATSMSTSNAYREADANNRLRISSDVAESLKNNSELSKISAGVRGEDGQTSALAKAFVAASKESNEEIESVSKLMGSLNYGKTQFGEIFSKNIGDEIDHGGVKLKITDNMRKAAADRMIQTGDLGDIVDIMENTSVQNGGEFEKVRSALTDAFKKNKKDDMQFFPGSSFEKLALEGMSKGDVSGALANKFVTDFSAEKASKMSADTIQLLIDRELATLSGNRTYLQTEINKLKANDDLYSKMSQKQKDAFDNMLSLI